MIEVFLLLAFIVIITALILLTRAGNIISHEIDELEEELEHHRIKLKQLDFYNLSDHEKRLDQLEKVLELKEYFDEESLTK